MTTTLTKDNPVPSPSPNDDWWHPKGRHAALHKITPQRFEYFSEKVEDGLTGKRVLDLGCGGGLLSERFNGAGAKVTGIDLSARAIESAKRHARESGGLDIDYSVGSAADLVDKKVEPFDVVVCSEVFEHVKDLDGFVRDACALLRDGGVFLFSTINKTLKARFLLITVAEDILGMVGKGMHDPAMFIKPSTLVGLFRKNNVDVRELKGLSYDPLRFTFKITSDTSVNYIGFGVKGKAAV